MEHDEVIYGAVWHLFIGSSNVHSCRYEIDSQILQVRFIDKDTGGGGSVYDYYDVPVDIVEGFLRASSAGSFVWSYLRGVFAYQLATPRGMSPAHERMDWIDKGKNQRRQSDQDYDYDLEIWEEFGRRGDE